MKYKIIVIIKTYGAENMIGNGIGFFGFISVISVNLV